MCVIVPAISPDGERIVTSTNGIGDNDYRMMAPASGRRYSC